MLRAFGFSALWCDLIFRNIANCWYSIAWDGELYGHFKSNRGVRQGDPLSPSLFILAMEYFSRSLNHAVENKKICAYKTKGYICDIHHLLYADDLLIFLNGHKNSIRHLLTLIGKFYGASGQMLNPAKSKVFFSDKISEVRRKDILEITNFKADKFPVSYLGAPIFDSRTKASYFKHLEDVVRSKIAGWAKKIYQ
ncbi:hypothetical protein QQ045_024387 [Rhodiola kirilowii]